MIVLDASILLYAYNPSFPQHGVVRAWLERTLARPAPVGLRWITTTAFCAGCCWRPRRAGRR